MLYVKNKKNKTNGCHRNKDTSNKAKQTNGYNSKLRAGVS